MERIVQTLRCSTGFLYWYKYYICLIRSQIAKKKTKKKQQQQQQTILRL